MYFIIAVWGHENKEYAAMKFFHLHSGQWYVDADFHTGIGVLSLYRMPVLSFSYFDLLGTNIPAEYAFWVMLGFFLAFATKLPTVPYA